jgi:hypothetical protein
MDSVSLESKITHYTAKSKGFLAFNIDFTMHFDIPSLLQEIGVGLKLNADSSSINRPMTLIFGLLTLISVPDEDRAAYWIRFQARVFLSLGGR